MNLHKTNDLLIDFLLQTCYTVINISIKQRLVFNDQTNFAQSRKFNHERGVEIWQKIC